MVNRHIVQSGDWGILEKEYHSIPLKQCLKNAFYAGYALDEATQLCRGEEDRYVVDSPYNTYMNGGYWATPSGWFVYGLYLRQPELAKQFISEYLAFVAENRENGAPYEWFHPVTGKRSGLRYGTSGTAMCAAVEKMNL